MFIYLSKLAEPTQKAIGKLEGTNEETRRKSGGGNRRKQRYRAGGSEAAAGRGCTSSDFGAQRQDTRRSSQDDRQWCAGGAVRRGQTGRSGQVVCGGFQEVRKDRRAVCQCRDLQVCTAGGVDRKLLRRNL